LGVLLQIKGGKAMGNILMTLIGIGMIVPAYTCFKDVPFIGTVFLMPGESILHAKIVDPMVRHALFMVGTIFAASGIILQISAGFDNAFNESSRNTAQGKSAYKEDGKGQSVSGYGEEG
jgi:hypothetical protein